MSKPTAAPPARAPYIALGVTQQGRPVPTLLARAAARGRALVQRYLIADDPADAAPWAQQPPPGVQLRQGWEDEQIDACGPSLALSILLVAAFAALFLLSGCTVMRIGPPDEAPAVVWASCPPLGELKRHDADAMRLRVAEIEARYEQCRNAALEPRP